MQGRSDDDPTPLGIRKRGLGTERAPDANPLIAEGKDAEFEQAGLGRAAWVGSALARSALRDAPLTFAVAAAVEAWVA